MPFASFLLIGISAPLIDDKGARIRIFLNNDAVAFTSSLELLIRLEAHRFIFRMALFGEYHLLEQYLNLIF